MAKILYGGGFDPIHNGHLNMAHCASIQFNADVVFVPAPVAIWKNSSINPKDKIGMIQVAIAKYPRFSLDLFEINSGKTTNYSIDTVKHFKEVEPDEKIYYLIGSDQVNEFHRWKNCEELSNLAQIIYFPRPGHKLSHTNIRKFHMMEVKGSCSSAASRDIRHLQSVDVPFEVLQYIEEHSLYWISRIKSLLTEQRFNHSLEVAHLAYKVAAVNGLDPEKAYIAGILHDIGKDVFDEEKRAIMERLFSEDLDLPPFAYHQFVGSFIATQDFEIEDELILNAIKYHATGRDGMSWLEKVVYACDKIEPTRGFDSSDLIKAMMENYDLGFITVLKANKEFLENNRKDINNRLTFNCFKDYLG